MVRLLFFGMTAIALILSSTTLHAQDCAPGITLASPYDSIITCRHPEVSLTAFSNSPKAKIWWTYPDGTRHNGNTLIAHEPGYYTAVAQNPGETHTSNQQVLVTDARIVPQCWAIGGEITCRDQTTNLHLGAFPPNVHFSWAGPSGFQSDLPNPSVSVQGTYIVTVLEPKSGCTVSDTVEVTTDQHAPIAYAKVAHQLTCEHPEAMVSGKGSSEGLQFVYFWWSERGYPVEPADAIHAKVEYAGIYNLMVVNTLNGCISTAQVSVVEGAGVSRK